WSRRTTTTPSRGSLRGIFAGDRRDVEILVACRVDQVWETGDGSADLELLGSFVAPEDGDPGAFRGVLGGDRCKRDDLLRPLCVCVARGGTDVLAIDEYLVGPQRLGLVVDARGVAEVVGRQVDRRHVLSIRREACRIHLGHV